MPRAARASQTPNRDLGSLSPAIPQPKGWREDVGDARIWVASRGEDAVAISVLLRLSDYTESPRGDSRVLNHLNPCESPFTHKDSSFQLWPFTRWESLGRGEQQFVSITLIFRVILWAVGPPPDPASIFLPLLTEVWPVWTPPVGSVVPGCLLGLVVSPCESGAWPVSSSPQAGSVLSKSAASLKTAAFHHSFLPSYGDSTALDPLGPEGISGMLILAPNSLIVPSNSLCPEGCH